MSTPYRSTHEQKPRIIRRFGFLDYARLTDRNGNDRLVLLGGDLTPFIFALVVLPFWLAVGAGLVWALEWVAS